jgi:hypothetical protein
VSARAEGISSEYLWYQVIPKMEGEGWCGLAVRTRDGTMLGAVVGVFAQGPLAGWLRMQGDYRRWTSWTGTYNLEARLVAIMGGSEGMPHRMDGGALDARVLARLMKLVVCHVVAIVSS